MQLYLHIPFCVRKCAYCDFLSFPADRDAQRNYVEALLAEIRAAGEEKAATRGGQGSHSGNEDAADEPLLAQNKQEWEVSSVYLGGGTPSILPAEWIAEILDAARGAFVFAEDVEITIEANPGTVDAEKLIHYRAAGINRLSFGCQSANNAELSAIGRIHTFADFLESYRLSREAGFSNINVDLMFGLPGQTLASWEQSLAAVTELCPEHISAYSLILEEGTPLATRYLGDPSTKSGTKMHPLTDEGESHPAADEVPDRHDFPPLPEEDVERVMFERTGEILAGFGYEQYEISNYAKPGFACRHNLGYWTGEEYLGLGLGAASYVPVLLESNTAKKASADSRTNNPGGARKTTEVDRVQQVALRYKNTENLEAYLVHSNNPASIRQVEERLAREDRMAEFMILGLRMTDGVSEEEFARRFGAPIDEIYGDIINKYMSLGLLTQDSHIRLTRRGQSLANVVMSEFI